MIFETNKDKGRAGLSAVIAYFGMNGYNVSIPLNDTQNYDLVIEKNGLFQKVQCKATGSKDGNVELKTKIGKGTNVGEICYTFIETDVDILFCLNQNGTMFCIPREDILKAGNKKAIKLKEEPLSKFANKECIDTYKYIVKF